MWIMTLVSPIGPDGTSARGKMSPPNERKCDQLPRIHTEPKKTRVANLTREQYNGLPFAFLRVQKGT